MAKDRTPRQKVKRAKDIAQPQKKESTVIISSLSEMFPEVSANFESFLVSRIPVSMSNVRVLINTDNSNVNFPYRISLNPFEDQVTIIEGQLGKVNTEIPIGELSKGDVVKIELEIQEAIPVLFITLLGGTNG